MVQGYANPNNSFLLTSCLMGVGGEDGDQKVMGKKGNFLEIKGTLKGSKQTLV